MFIAHQFIKLLLRAQMRRFARANAHGMAIVLNTPAFGAVRQLGFQNLFKLGLVLFIEHRKGNFDAMVEMRCIQSADESKYSGLPLLWK
jgi:hypothetical protein